MYSTVTAVSQNRVMIDKHVTYEPVTLRFLVCHDCHHWVNPNYFRCDCHCHTIAVTLNERYGTLGVARDSSNARRRSLGQGSNRQSCTSSERFQCDINSQERATRNPGWGTGEDEGAQDIAYPQDYKESDDPRTSWVRQLGRSTVVN